MTAPAKTTRPSAPKRYGPLIGIVVVILLVGGGILAFSGGGSGDQNTADVGTTPSAVGLPLTFNQAENEGTASSINWGPNCNTTLGQVKIPSIDAPSCVKPYDPSKGNGGATAGGVTADSINLVYYIADPKLDPPFSADVPAASADANPDAQFRTALGLRRHLPEALRAVGPQRSTSSSSSVRGRAPTRRPPRRTR